VVFRCVIRCSYASWSQCFERK